MGVQSRKAAKRNSFGMEREWFGKKEVVLLTDYFKH